MIVFAIRLFTRWWDSDRRYAEVQFRVDMTQGVAFLSNQIGVMDFAELSLGDHRSGFHVATKRGSHKLQATVICDRGALLQCRPRSGRRCLHCLERSELMEGVTQDRNEFGFWESAEDFWDFGSVVWRLEEWPGSFEKNQLPRKLDER